MDGDGRAADGHGSDGDSCSYFVRDHIESELKRQIKAGKAPSISGPQVHAKNLAVLFMTEWCVSRRDGAFAASMVRFPPGWADYYKAI